MYVTALRNGYALDDIPIIVRNPTIHDARGFLFAFVRPYWESFGGGAHRPLAILTYWIDGRIDGAPWFHFINLLWHAGVAVAVAALARRWSELKAALIAGLLFAVHPVHVEAVANIVGRAELMAALFACLAVYAALAQGSVVWSGIALAAGLLSKETAAVIPGLIVWAWIIGLARPSRRRATVFVISWLVIGIAYGAMRWSVLHPYARFNALAPVFVGASFVSIRLTAVAALGDIARLLVFPLHLRADYSPGERTLIQSAFDPRFLIGLAIAGFWVVLVLRAWRRRQTIELLGLGWIAIAYLPVSNLLFPIGILTAERTLYLPSIGLVLAMGAWFSRWPDRQWQSALALLVVLGSVRTIVRVPVWRSEDRLTLSILDDSPESYVGPFRAADRVEVAGDLAKSLSYLRIAISKNATDPRPFYSAADLAFTLHQPVFADSMLAYADGLCSRCTAYYQTRAARARARGDTATARWLLDKTRAWESR